MFMSGSIRLFDCWKIANGTTGNKRLNTGMAPVWVALGLPGGRPLEMAADTRIIS